MKRITSLVVLTGAAALVACASQAPAPSGASTGQRTALVAGQGSAAAQNTTFKAPDGYTRKVVKGQEVYCREDAINGSRVKSHQVCLTQQQLENGSGGPDAYERSENEQGAAAADGTASANDNHVN